MVESECSFGDRRSQSDHPHHEEDELYVWSRRYVPQQPLTRVPKKLVSVHVRDHIRSALKKSEDVAEDIPPATFLYAAELLRRVRTLNGDSGNILLLYHLVQCRNTGAHDVFELLDLFVHTRGQIFVDLLLRGSWLRIHLRNCREQSRKFVVQSHREVQRVLGRP